MSKLTTYSPVDGSIYVERDYASSTVIDTTLENANSAYESWRDTSLADRKKLCAAAVDCFVANQEQICTELTWQMGRPRRFGPGEINGFVERASHMISIADEALATIAVENKAGFTRYIKREPVGVVFVVAPWNYPYLTSVNSIMPALLAGNTVVLKHSTQTPLCAERLYDAFQAAGLPQGVFQFLHLSHDDTRNIIQSSRVNHVAFTGSVGGGADIEKYAAGQFMGVGLELGGKDPAYIRADANLPHAIDTVTDGAFFNSGQSCCGIERIYVDSKIFEDVVSGVTGLVNQYVLGRPDDNETTLGPVVRPSAANFIREQTASAISAGAKGLIDPANFPNAESGGVYLAPQVLVNVDHSMAVMTEETFGPVVGIMAVASDEQAIQLMNDSDFGLTASVFTEDEDAAIRIGDRVNTGTWFMNRCDYLDPALAWTGVKHSGRGCTLSSIGFEHLTRPKSYHLKTTI
jgi:acyl-CoA reductase-like NAD-dependent aldehyde dehydrogenase